MKSNKKCFAAFSVAMFTLATITAQSATTYYVNPSGNGSTGTSWATAMKTIQAAIDISKNGDTIIVTNGVYAPIVSTNLLITIKSVNGAKVTTIDGDDEKRCATLGLKSGDTNTVLIGFTLRNGYSHTKADVYYAGGGSCYGTLYNCLISNNEAMTQGGGAYRSILYNCTLSDNYTGHEGGGAYSCALNNCKVFANFSYDGGGTYGGTLNNCLLIGNEAFNSGSGAYDGVLKNCTLFGNTIYFVSGAGGAAYLCVLQNCIIWNNPAGNHIKCDVVFSCTNIKPKDGTGNIDEDPLFVDAENGDFRLQLGSPCINTGSNALTDGITDLIGNQRLWGDKVDMGAYEMQYPEVLNYTDWLLYHKLQQSSENETKWVRGLDPKNANAKFLTHITMRDGKPVLNWTPNLNKLRTYSIEGKTELTDSWKVIPSSEMSTTSAKFFRVKVATP